MFILPLVGLLMMFKSDIVVFNSAVFIYCLFLLELSLAQLQSGEFIKVKEPAALLACPQSLNTLDGFGHCVGMIPLGSARVRGLSSKGKDIFVQCNAQMKPPQGNRFTYRYPYVKKDTRTNVPVFDAPVQIPPFQLNSSHGLLPKFVWEAKETASNYSSRSVRAAAFTQTCMYILGLNANLNEWMLLRSVPFVLPLHLNNSLSLSSVVVVENVGSTEAGDPGTGWTLYVTLKTGTSARAHDIFPAKTNWRSVNFHPYGGDGIYNGNIDLIGIASFEVNDKGSSSNFQIHTPGTWSGGLMNLNLGLLQQDNGNKMYLLAGSRTGLIYKRPIFSASTDTVGKTKVMENNYNEWKLVPAVDASTNTLFKSSKIDAKPIGYDDNHIIIACENGLHFVEEVNSDNYTLKLNNQVKLLNMGEVLENNALLVTGQTPTVSIADWDHDGLLDIIAGSSEGRFFFSKQSFSSSVNDMNSANIFHRPVALHHNDTATDVATSDRFKFSSEILVQGGYRIDIQGPRESRWGYTAPVS